MIRKLKEENESREKREAEAKKAKEKEEPKASKGIDAIMNFGLGGMFDTFLEEDSTSSSKAQA